MKQVMSSSGEVWSFVKVAAEKVEEKRKLKIKKIEVPEEEIESNKKFMIDNEEGHLVIKPPREEAKGSAIRSVCFRSIERESNSAKYPTLEYVKPGFQDWWENIIYIGRKEQYGVIEVVFDSRETATKIAART